MSAARIVVLAGPTAGGKSALALALAERLPLEIVSVDSQQVYRGLDVGTAKPTLAERRRVPHHLLDLAEPGEQLDAAAFVARADAAIAEVAGRGRLPLVVGGTGLWTRALLWGLAAAPPRDPAVRAELEAEADRSGSAALHTRLAAVDPEAAARLHPNDRLRVVRALEVHALTGRPISELQRAHGFATARYPHRMLALKVERETLRARIRARVGQMLASGWLEETRRLMAHPDAAHRIPRVLGYAEVAAHLEGRLDRTALEETLAARTWQYARRQLVWLKGAPGVEWLEPPVDVDRLAADLLGWWEGPGNPGIPSR